MIEYSIQDAIVLYGDHRRRYELMVPNCYTSHDNEADVLAVRKSGLCDEFEIKVSRSDFFNDAKKIVATRQADWRNGEYHEWNQNGSPRPAPWEKLKYDALLAGEMTCNYFWYVIKEGIVTPDEVPEWAGLITVRDDPFPYRLHRVIRHPKRLHANKMSDKELYKLTRKLHFRYWSMRTGISI